MGLVSLEFLDLGVSSIWDFGDFESHTAGSIGRLIFVCISRLNPADS